MSDEKHKKTSGKSSRVGWMRVEARFMDAGVLRLEKASWASCRRTGAWLGLAFHNALAARRNIATENVRLAFPGMSKREAARIARRASQNMFMTMCESLRMGAATEEEIREYSPSLGFEHLQAARESGQGTIVLSGHFGNWEMLGARLAQEFPLTALARPNSNAGIEKHVAKMRESVGIDVISKWETARAALRVLRQGEVLILLPDQRAGSGEGILLPMFGHRTRFYTSVAQFSLLTGAPIVPAFGVRRAPWLADGRIDSMCFPALPMPQAACASAENKRATRDEDTMRITQNVIGALEDAIRRNPDQWWWIHRRWRSGECETLPDWARSVGKNRPRSKPRKRRK